MSQVERNSLVTLFYRLGLPNGDVLEIEYNTTGEDDWTPFVLQMKSEGIQHLHFVGTCVPNFVGLMTAAFNPG